jgi:hypothetical protein
MYKKFFSKSIIASLFIVFSTLSLSAQTSGAGFVELGTDLNVGKFKGASFGLKGGYGLQWNNFIYTGLGAGVSTDSKFNSIGIPVFLRLKTDFSTGTVRPFLQLDGGYGIPTEGPGSAFINPALGVAFPAGNGGSSLYLSTGYNHVFFEGGGIGAISINLGMFFGRPGGDYVRNRPTAFGKFLRRTMLATHLGHGIGLGSTEGLKSTGFTSLKLAWLYEITPSISAGVGTGVNVHHFTGDWEDAGLTHERSIPVYLSAQWRSSGGKLRPLVRVDVGQGYYEFGDWGEEMTTGSGVHLEAAGGVSFVRREKHSWDMMLVLTSQSFRTVRYDSSMVGDGFYANEYSPVCMGLRIGFTL